MIFDIGLFGGGEESNSFTQERFTDHEGEDVSVYLYLGTWGTNGKYLLLYFTFIFHNSHHYDFQSTKGFRKPTIKVSTYNIVC